MNLQAILVQVKQRNISSSPAFAAGARCFRTDGLLRVAASVEPCGMLHSKARGPANTASSPGTLQSNGMSSNAAVLSKDIMRLKEDIQGELSKPVNQSNPSGTPQERRKQLLQETFDPEDATAQEADLKERLNEALADGTIEGQDAKQVAKQLVELRDLQFTRV